MVDGDRPGAELLLSPADLRGVVTRLAAELETAYPDGVVLVGVLKGSIVFLSDLVRRLRVPVLVDLVAVSAYAAGGRRARLVKDLDIDVAGRDVVVVEDLVDTGLTLGFLLGTLRRRRPASLAVCTLLDQPARRLLPVDLRFRGVEIPDTLVVGYGLDFAGRYRNLDGVWTVDPAVLAADPDAYVRRLHPPGPPSGPPSAR